MNSRLNVRRKPPIEPIYEARIWDGTLDGMHELIDWAKPVYPLPADLGMQDLETTPVVILFEGGYNMTTRGSFWALYEVVTEDSDA